MRKTQSNAAWNGMSAEQRATLERWLFEENLSYETAFERAKKELGYPGSVTSLKRFYQRMSEVRLLRLGAAEDDDMDEQECLRATMREVGRLALQKLRDDPEAIAEWAAPARLLLHSEANLLNAEKNAIWRGGLALAREKFEFDSAEAALKQLDNREDLDAEEIAREKARILAIRTRLYGRQLTQEEIARGEQDA